MSPLLSICIPTRNRGLLLRESLFANLGPQIESRRDLVEIVVSNNASTDDTAQVLDEASQRLGIRCSHQAENIGIPRNMCHLVKDLARGRYCWFLGDDDLIINDGLPRVIDALAEQGDLEYVYVNRVEQDLEFRQRILNGEEIPREAMSPFFRSQDIANCAIEKWQDILFGQSFSDATGWTSLLCQVFKRDSWLRVAEQMRFGDVQAEFRTLSDTYPHFVVWCKSCGGLPGYYIGLPPVFQATKHQEWLALRGLSAFGERLMEAVDFMKERGMLNEEGYRQLRAGYARQLLSVMELRASAGAPICESWWGALRFVLGNFRLVAQEPRRFGRLLKIGLIPASVRAVYRRAKAQAVGACRRLFPQAKSE